ncbi:hypothetical protein Tco_0451288 [Tanacetum coccineum]
MTELILEKYIKKAQTESHLSITSNDINIELSKEFLEELQMNAYHGWIDEDVINHIAMIRKILQLRTEISSPYEDLSDIGSPGAEGPIFQDPPSPDYVPGPEEPEQAPPSPIYVPFVPEPVYPEFLPEDDVLPAEEQPLPVAASPTTEEPSDDDDDDDAEEEEHLDPANPAAIAYSAD